VKKHVWTFGLIAGAILSVMMVATLPFMEEIGDAGAVIGYASMVAAFLLIFFGVRSYRDNVAGGSVGFGRAFAVGILIAAIGSACYVATWEVIYFRFHPDFLEKYQARQLDKARQAGASQQELDKQLADMQKLAKLYQNPAVNMAMTFAEPFPVGLVIALVSAGVLSRRRRESAGSPATVPS
jgi:hypothetical protein